MDTDCIGVTPVITPNSPTHERMGVMLAQAVLHEDHEVPDRNLPVVVHTSEGHWLPTANEWILTCEVVERILAEDEISTLITNLVLTVTTNGQLPPEMTTGWTEATPTTRQFILLLLAWYAKDADAIIDHPTAHALQTTARAHIQDQGNLYTWAGGEQFPTLLPDHAGTTLARHLDNDPEVSLRTAGLLAAKASTCGDRG